MYRVKPIAERKRASFTFQRPGVGRARLDRWYVPKERVENLVSIENITTLSDHMAVKLKLKIEGMEKRRKERHGGMVYWKLNTKLLEEPQLKDQVEEMMKILQDEKKNYEDDAIWWEDLVKPYLREKLIKYSKYRARARADTIKALFFLSRRRKRN